MAMRKKFDRISRFPDDILCRILTFLPVIEAVRTSVLSSRWRYLFASMSTLDFDESLCEINNVRYFKKVVDRFLYFPNHVSLECFRLTSSIADYEYDDYLPGWICAALCRNVKEIDLCFYSRDDVLTLPALLFTCQSLVTLKLNVEGRDLKVPSTVCLPNLKTLHLKNLAFSDGCSIPKLISNCHVVEDLALTVFKCEFDDTSELNIHNPSLKRLVLDFDDVECKDVEFLIVIVVNAPSLVYFQYIGPVAEGYTFSNMASLEKADIRILRFDYEVDIEESATSLLQGVCDVRSLYLSFEDDEGTLFKMPIDSVPAFHNLVELEFHNSGNDDGRGTWLMEFLHYVPNLKTLILSLAVARWNPMSLPKEVPSCLSFHVEQIKISNFRGDVHMLAMLSYFLENAVVLEKLKIGLGTLCESDKSSIFKKLLSLPRNSKKCHVVTF